MCDMGRVHIGVSTELLMRHVWGEGVTSSSKCLLASRAISLKEFARLSLSLVLLLNDVKQERTGEVGVKCQFACSLMSLLLDAREESTIKRATGEIGRIFSILLPLRNDSTSINALTCVPFAFRNVKQPFNLNVVYIIFYTLLW